MKLLINSIGKISGAIHQIGPAKCFKMADNSVLFDADVVVIKK